MTGGVGLFSKCQFLTSLLIVLSGSAYTSLQRRRGNVLVIHERGLWMSKWILLVTSQIEKNPSLCHRQLLLSYQRKSCKVVFSWSWYHYIIIMINSVWLYLLETTSVSVFMVIFILTSPKSNNLKFVCEWLLGVMLRLSRKVALLLSCYLCQSRM